MAKASIQVIEAISKTIQNLDNGSSYQWGHMGSCNCGNLAQVITDLDKAEIHKSAMLRHGDWNEQLIDYCPTSGLPIDHIIDEMLNFGFTRQDLAHLEKLSDPKIIKYLPNDRKYLKHNAKQDVILYLKTWKNILQEQLIEAVSISDIHEKEFVY